MPPSTSDSSRRSQRPAADTDSGIAPVVTVSVQFPELSVPEFRAVRERLCAGHPDRVVIAHEAHRWYTASTDPDAVRALVSGLRAALGGGRLCFDGEEALDDLSQEYADWLEESAEIADEDDGPVMTFSVHLPALDRDEFARLLGALREQHPRRIVLGEQRGHSHHEVVDRHTIELRLPAVRAAAQGRPLTPQQRLPLLALLNDYASWLPDPADPAPAED